MFLKKVTDVKGLKHIVRKLRKEQGVYDYLLEFIWATDLDAALDEQGIVRHKVVEAQFFEKCKECDYSKLSPADIDVIRYNEIQRAVRLLEHIKLPVYVCGYLEKFKDDDNLVVRFFTEDEIAMGDEDED